MDFLPVQRFDRMLGFPGLDEPTEPCVLGRDGAGQFHHRFVAPGGAFLRQVTEGNVALPGDLAGIGRLGSQDERKEGGLARSVRADQPDAVLAVDLQGDVGEQHASAVSLADAGESQHATSREGPVGPG